MYVIKHYTEGISKTFFENKRTNRVYNIPVKYALKYIGRQSFVDYFEPTYFNCLPLQLKK